MKIYIDGRYYNSDVCFMTGTGAEIIRVTNIDGRQIGKGEPGMITQKLIQNFKGIVAV